MRQYCAFTPKLRAFAPLIGAVVLGLTLLANSRQTKAQAGDWFIADIGGARAACIMNRDAVIAGLLQRSRYVTYQSRIKRLTSTLRRERNTRRRAIIRIQIRSLRAQAELAQIVCEHFLRQVAATPTPSAPGLPPEPTPPVGATPTPTRDPMPTRTPLPTPTPTPMRYFDAAGSLTEYGKQQLGVPSQFEATIDIGEISYTYRCTQCHGEYGGRTFSNYRTAISAPPMYFIPPVLGDNELAHLTAYLNRFRE